MNTKEFFDQFHLTLADKYNIPEDYIATIRSFALGQNWLKEDIMDWADEKIKLYKQKNKKPRKRWKEIFNFLESLSNEDWNKILKKTKFDKKNLP